MARTPSISKVKKTLKDTASVTTETVGQVVGKARDTVEAVSPVKLPKRGPGARKKTTAPAPERLQPQDAPRKTHGDALGAGDGSPPIATRKSTVEKSGAKKSSAKKAPAKKAPAKKTPTKKTAAKKTTAKETAAKKTAAKKTAAKSSTTKKAPAKRSAAKKSAVKKSAAKKS